MWLSENEGAKFWLNVLMELQNRGVKDILIACVDGLKGFPEAIQAVYPKTQIQLCIVHRVHNKVIYLAIQEASKKWTMPIRHWKTALNRFMIEFEDRLEDFV